MSEAATNAAAQTWQSFGGAHPVLGALGGILGSQDGRVATRDFVEGVAGVSAAPVRAAVPATVAPALAAKPAAVAAAPAAEPDMYARQATYLNNMLKNGLSMGELQRVTGMMPARAVNKPKDNATMVATQLTLAEADRRAAEIKKLDVSDPEAAAVERKSAAKDLLDRLTLLGGANPTNMGYLPGMEEGN